MAGFKTHITVGTFTGFALMLLSYVAGLTANLTVAILVFLNTGIGSFLPDLDSDSGLPVKIIFGVYGLLLAALVFFISYNATNFNTIITIALTIVTYIIVQFILQPLFKKYTKHRGMFHSVPAIFISFLIALISLGYFNINELDKFLLSTAISVGYFSHLLLDEIYSTNILTGKIKPKKSLGTALKFTSHSKKQNIAVYSFLILLLFIAMPTIFDIFEDILEIIA